MIRRVIVRALVAVAMLGALITVAVLIEAAMIALGWVTP